MSDTVDEIFEAVADTGAQVRSALSERRAYEEAENPSGETQLAADIYADELLEEHLLALDGVGSYASEERQDVVTADEGSFHVAADPLDGSSNLKSNNGMGTIFAVYDEELPAHGDALVASGYVLYGPITTMVTASDGTVTEYLIRDGETELLNEDLAVPADPTVYGFGGRLPDWPETFDQYVEEIEADRLKLRYGGAMVADVNQVMTYGGIFGYPMLQDTPEGKLRLMYEGHPIAHVVETAGGASSNGERSLLETQPDHLHQRTPLFVGTTSLIERLEAALE